MMIKLIRIYQNWKAEWFYPGRTKDPSCLILQLRNQYVVQPIRLSDNFLSFCYACKKNLGQGKDIYMYSGSNHKKCSFYIGEKSFCSSESRYEEKLLEEGIDKFDDEDGYGTCS
ncbi:conserved hypothetical protein [Ricinus communis]|uniref:FLZ-type domain-containing protein n=1 Tax=Ricinus communis TaxID=3988 RepID=B9SL74_RICCO|nr:conserved hypothetical protein [Ricinus communis]